MEEDLPEGGGDTSRNPKPKPASYQGKSCKGCLYYTSVRKSNGRNPMCVGITRSLPKVPAHIVGESEVEASKDGRSLSHFKYACVGYSVFLDNKDSPGDQKEKPTELPFCAGIELLVDRSASTTSHAPAHVHNKDIDARPQQRPHKPAQSTGDEFFTRFTRNAGLVASGVARNLNKVGHYIKDTFDGMYPHSRRPK